MHSNNRNANKECHEYTHIRARARTHTHYICMTFDGERNIQGDRGCNRRNEGHLRVRIRTPPSPHSSDNHSPTPFSALPYLCNQILVLQINGAKWEGKKKKLHIRTYVRIQIL